MNLITGSVLNSFTGAFADHFDTFSANTRIIVFKEPIKTIVPGSTPDTYFGYGEDQPNVTYTYTPVSGIFPAIKVFKKENDDTFSVQNKTRNPEAVITVKVRLDAKNFIENGKNEYVILNDCSYNDISTSRPQNFFGLVYYYFDLKKTD